MSNLGTILGWAFHGFVALTLASAGLIKIIKPPKPVIDNFTKWNLLRKIRLIGLGELVSAVLILIPATTNLGAMVVSAVWGGAIVIHLAHEESFLVLLLFLLLDWLGFILKNQALFGL